MATAIESPKFTINPHSAGFSAQVKIIDGHEILFERTKELGRGTFLDITSYNGEIHAKMSDMCGCKLKKDIQGIGNSVLAYQQGSMRPTEGQPVVGTCVIDYRDPSHGLPQRYSDPQIKVVEKALCEQLDLTKKPSFKGQALQSLRGQFKEQDVQYVICEGSIKHDMLYEWKMFTPQEQEFLTSPENSPYLCHTAELFITALRMGYQPLGPFSSLTDYVHAVGPNGEFTPLPRSITVYPSTYAESRTDLSPVVGPFTPAMKACNVFENTVTQPIVMQNAHNAYAEGNRQSSEPATVVISDLRHL